MLFDKKYVDRHFGYNFWKWNLSKFKCQKDPYTEDERKRIERGESIEQKDDETFVIPDGPYIFEQIPFLPEERELIRVLLPYLSKTETEVYVRIYKENMLETVMQLLFPIG